MQGAVHPDCEARLDAVANYTRPRARGRFKAGNMTTGETKTQAKRTRGKIHITPEFVQYMDNKLQVLERNPDAWVMAVGKNIARDLGIEPYAASLGITVYADLMLPKYKVETNRGGTAFIPRSPEEVKALETTPLAFRNVHPDDLDTIDSYINAEHAKNPEAPVLVNAPILSKRGFPLKTRPQCHWMIFQAYFAKHPERHIAWGGIMTIYRRNDAPGDYISYITGPFHLYGLEGTNLARKLCAEAQHE